jgi:hypothetical protein|tara:strand:- start:264 stop:407 length:144 start_codon:yes stop_codon:yes gene_type:complete
LAGKKPCSLLSIQAHGKKPCGHEGWQAVEEGRLSHIVGLGPYLTEFE